jgi:cytochrome c biogenesis protein CcdA
VGQGPLLYAFALGLVAAFNPCGFPLLPAYLAVALGGQGAGAGLPTRLMRALAAGLAMTAGFVVVFGALGLLARQGVALATGWIPAPMIAVGVLLAAVGVAATAGRYPRVPVPTWLRTGRRGVASLALFGVVYAIGSLSCALPIFLAGVSSSFTAAGATQGVGTFLAYALGMGLVIVVVSLAGAAGAGAMGAGRLLAWQPLVGRLAGAALSLSGAYVAYYWSEYLAHPNHVPALAATIERLGTNLSNLLSASPRTSGAVLGAIVIASLAWLAAATRRRSADPPGPPPGLPEVPS